MENSEPKWYWNAPFPTPEAKAFLGEDPQTLKEDILFGVHLNKHMHTLTARHYALSDFLVEIHFDP